MMMLHLKPSEIFYSQDSISGRFHLSSNNIGDTLDALFYRRIRVSDIPTISVVKKDDKWITLDNRRLWIFHHLQGAGKCDTVPVKEVRYSSNHSRKFTSNNYGTSISFRNSERPGGKCHLFITPVKPQLPQKMVSEATLSESVSVMETKPPTTQSSTTSNIKTVHPHSFLKPKVDTSSVKLKDVKTNKTCSIPTEDAINKIVDCTKLEKGKILTSKGVNKFKNKINLQKELIRKAQKTSWGLNNATKIRRTCFTWLPHRHHYKSPFYPTRGHFWTSFYLKRRNNWRKKQRQRYHANKIICRPIKNISTDDKINYDLVLYEKFEEEKFNSELMYPSELDSNIENAGSDEDNIEMDYEDEPYYFYELDTFQTIPAVSDTSEDENKDTNDESEDNDTDYDGEAEDNDETDTGDDKSLLTGNINEVLDGERTLSDRHICNNHYIKEVNEEDEYQNEKEWFYDCFDNCYRKIKK